MKNEIIKSLAEEVWENILWEGMESVLYSDGDIWTRQQGSTGVDEDEIIFKVDLSPDNWVDSFAVIVHDGIAEKDSSMYEEFIQVFSAELIEDLERIQ